MKDILHLKNIYYSKKCGFMFPYEIDQFLKMLLMRFKPKDTISCVS